MIIDENGEIYLMILAAAAGIFLLIRCCFHCCTFATENPHTISLTMPTIPTPTPDSRFMYFMYDHNYDDENEEEDDSNNVGSIALVKRSDSARMVIEVSGDDSRVFVVSVTGESCSICLEEFKIGDECRVFVKCSHVHHKVCIDSWLSQHKLCPLCRSPAKYSLNIDSMV